MSARRIPATSRGASTFRVRARSSAVWMRSDPSRWRWSSALGIARSQACRSIGSAGAARRGRATAPVGSSTGPMLRCRPMPRTLRLALVAILWLLIAAVIAIGGAGLVAATKNEPGTASRAELTAAGDAAASPGLDRAESGLQGLTADVQHLGELGRDGLGALVDSNFGNLDQTVADGQALAASIEDRSAALRDILSNTIDVTTLTQWIDRNAEYDAALKRLYRATVAAKGRLTDELKAAAIGERRAHDLLPANTSGLVIILAEIARGGLNQAVIGIEQARAQLQAAVDDLAAPASPTPGESGAPVASGTP